MSVFGSGLATEWRGGRTVGVPGECGQYCSTTPPSASSPPTPLSAHSFITRLMAALMTFLVMSTVIRYDRLYNSWRKPMSASKQLHWARRRAGCSTVDVQYLRTCVFRTVRARWVWRRPRVSSNTVYSVVEPKLRWTTPQVLCSTSLRGHTER